MVKITDISSPLIFGTRGGGGGGGGGIAKQVILLSVTSAPSGTFKKGSQYFNSTDKLIYTAIDDNTWNGARTSVPQFGVIYIFNDNGVTRYYVWDGDNLVESDLEKYQLISNKTDDFTESSSTKYPTSKALKDGLATKQNNLTAGASIKIEGDVISVIGEGEIGVVALVAMNSQPSTPYVVGSRWFYNSLIYTATSTTQTDGGKTPSTQATYLFDGVNYYWDGSQLQSVPQGNLVHISGEETITGPKTFAGGVNLGDNATTQTKPTSDTSNAPATTQFVKDFVEDGEWQKPVDWVDIRSGALDNSVYFLVAHSKPTESGGVYSIATYPKIKIVAEVSDSGTYDVYIDGIKILENKDSASENEIDWATLYNNGILQGGYDVNYPAKTPSLTTHVIRITPSLSTNTLTKVRENTNSSSPASSGLLWVHYALTNYISLQNAFTTSGILESITTTGETLKIINNINGAFGQAMNLINLPTLEFPLDNQLSVSGMFHPLANALNALKLKKIKFKNLRTGTNTYYLIGNHNKPASALKKILAENSIVQVHNQLFSGNPNLEKMELMLDFSNTENCTDLFEYCSKLAPFVIDASNGNTVKRLTIGGKSTARIDGLKSLTVSSDAPFNNATAPQIDVAYTGMDRAALVKLFKSLPSHIGYIINGEPTNNNGVFSGFSNANYLTMNKALPDLDNNSDFEVILRVTAPNPISQGMIFGSFITNSDVSLQLDGDNNLYGYIYDSANSVRREVMLQQAFTAGQATWVKYSIKNGTLTIGVSTDKITWREANLVLPDNFAYTKKTIPVFGGYTGETDNAFDGSINMPQSYIMKDGLPWFTGDGIARTLNCTGCTGTPDLTEDDKAIAENKGWSLILA